MKNVPLKSITCYLLLLFVILFYNTLDGQSQQNVYRTDIKTFLEEEYNFEHTFIRANNTRVPFLDCTTMGKMDSSHLNRYTPVHFLPSIIDRIPKTTNALIISENHLEYKSRDVLFDFIRLMKQEGYSTIYIEALSYDRGLNERGYPINESGYLLNEPGMGNLVRKLMKEGFKIYPYEQLNFQKESSERYVKNHFKEEHRIKKIKNERINKDQYELETMSFNLEMSTRDFSQFKNIMQTFDPQGKSIILCGHGHGMKIPYGGWRPLGYWLSLHAKVNVFSIENSGTIGQEDFTLNRMTCYYNQKEPFYLVDTSNNQIYSEKRYQPYENKKVGNLFDMNIFYPANYQAIEELEDPNPSNCRRVRVDKNKYKTPFLIIKYIGEEYEAEQENAIPLDIEIIQQSSMHKPIHICDNEIVFIWDGSQKFKLE